MLEKLQHKKVSAWEKKFNQVPKVYLGGTPPPNLRERGGFIHVTFSLFLGRLSVPTIPRGR